MTNPFVRRAGVADAPGIARVHVASSDEAYGPLAGEWPPGDAVARTEMWRANLLDQGAPVVLVAEDTERTVIGFVSGGPPRRPEPRAEVEVYVIHVHPAHRGRGVGERLWTGACEVLRGRERAAMYVDTLAELRCCSFYARHGGDLVERRPVDFFGAPRTHVTYRWARGAEDPTALAPELGEKNRRA